MKSSVKKVIVAACVVAVIAVIAILLSMRDVEDFHEKYAGTDLSMEIAGMEREGTYTGYLSDHAGAADIFGKLAHGTSGRSENRAGCAAVFLVQKIFQCHL